MDQEIATQWTNILRSEEFIQGTGYLRNADGEYCCLGVLCEMAVRAGVIPGAEHRGVYAYGHEDDSSISVLPRSVMNWAGMQSTNGWVDGFELSALNDGGMTFANLADVIDKNVKDL